MQSNFTIIYHSFGNELGIADSNFVLFFGSEAGVLSGFGDAQSGRHRDAWYPFASLLMDIVCNGLRRINR
jgi:hypothetical protein